VADFGIPHTGTLPNQFTGGDARSGVGEPGFLGAQVGVPHVTVTSSNVWTGTNPAGNVGEPNNLGVLPLGIPNP